MDVKTLSLTTILILLLVLQNACTLSNKQAKTFTGNELIKYSKLLSIKESKDTFLITVSTVDNKLFEYPISKRDTQYYHKIASLSSVFSGFLCEIEAQNSIIAVDDISFLSNPNLLTRNPTSVSTGGVINAELLISLHPDLIIHSGYGEISSILQDKLKSLNIPLFLCNNYLEENPLGRAEWIKAFGILSGKKEEAFSLFNKIESEYNALKGKTYPHQPRVMIGILFGGIWDVPAAQSYTAQLVQDAGGDYIWKNNGEAGRIPLSLETVAQTALNADIWLHPGAYKTLANMQSVEPRYADFSAFKNRMVFNNNKQVNTKGGNAFWETAPVRPQVVLRDLIQIFHSDSMQNLVYYQKLE